MPNYQNLFPNIHEWNMENWGKRYWWSEKQVRARCWGWVRECNIPLKKGTIRIRRTKSNLLWMWHHKTMNIIHCCSLSAYCSSNIRRYCYPEKKIEHLIERIVEILWIYKFVINNKWLKVFFSSFSFIFFSLFHKKKMFLALKRH